MLYLRGVHECLWVCLFFFCLICWLFGWGLLFLFFILLFFFVLTHSFIFRGILPNPIPLLQKIWPILPFSSKGLTNPKPLPETLWLILPNSSQRLTDSSPLLKEFWLILKPFQRMSDQSCILPQNSWHISRISDQSYLLLQKVGQSFHFPQKVWPIHPFSQTNPNPLSTEICPITPASLFSSILTPVLEILTYPKILLCRIG